MTIQATVRNGRLEPENPLDLPDGTVLTIPVPEANDEREESPEEIQRWIDWYNSFDPVQITDEERAAWDKIREEDKQWELSQWEARSKMLENLFP